MVADQEVALATPNCIMARPGETITIPAAKAFAVWEQNQELFGKKFEPRGDLGTMLVWAMPYNVVDGDEIDITDYEDINKATIKIKSRAGIYGNAMVALTVNGEIRWSWHLWITDYQPGADIQLDRLTTGPNDVPGGKVYRYKNNTGDNIFMDRNLGANSADETKGKETVGMYYQWGKKDPMPGFAPPNYIPQDYHDYPPIHLENNLAYSIEYPDEYIIGGPWGEWYSYEAGTYYPDLWGWESGKKSIYDPCPEGWKVPLAARELHELELSYHDPEYPPRYSPWYIIEPENQLVFTDPGNSRACESPVLGFFPRTDRIGNGGEVTTRYAYATLLWTASVCRPAGEESTHVYMAELDNNNTLYPWSEAAGLNVRCIRSFE